MAMLGVFLVVLVAVFLAVEHWHVLHPANLSDKEFNQKYGPWAVVAGASEGIGEAFCKELASRGLNLVMIARNVKKLEAAADKIESRYGVQVDKVPLDLSSENVRQVFTEITQERDVGLVVYNAAFSNVGLFLDAPLETHYKVLDVNTKAVITAVHVFGSKMRESRDSGGLILLSSMQGERGCRLTAGYAASKAWNSRLSEGLWDELRRYNIDVLGVLAGATRTPGYNNFTGDRGNPIIEQEPYEVAQEALQGLGQTPRLETGWVNKFSGYLMTVLPKRVGIAILGNEVSKRSDKDMDEQLRKHGMQGTT